CCGAAPPAGPRTGGLENLVEPRALRTFLQAKVHSARNISDRFVDSLTVRLDNLGRQAPARWSHHGKRKCLRVRGQPNVSVHNRPPLWRTLDTARSTAVAK